jgi:hypothetical protein
MVIAAVAYPTNKWRAYCVRAAITRCSRVDDIRRAKAEKRKRRVAGARGRFRPAMPPIATTRIAPRSVRATMLRRAVRSRNRKTRIMTDLRPRIEPQDIPPELDRWNWGAFLLNWIWGVGNNTYIALLTFVPFVGIVMPFVLGAKGSRWAWRNGRWDNVEHFKRVQRLWASGARSSGVRYDPNAAAANSGTVIMPPATPTVSWLRSQQLLRVHSRLGHHLGLGCPCAA